MTNLAPPINLDDFRSKTCCPVCGEGYLTEHTEPNHFVRQGIFVSCEFVYSLCDHCGSEQADAVQMRRNKDLGQNAFEQAILDLQGEKNNFH